MELIKRLRKSSFIVDFFSMFGSNIALLGIGLVTSMITTRALGPSGMGVFTVLTSFSLIFVSFSEMGIRQSNIYYTAKKEFSLNDIFSANILLATIFSLIGMGMFYGLLFGPNSEIDSPLVLLAALVIPVSIGNKYINGLMVGSDKISKNAGFNLLNGIVKVVLVILFLVVLDWNVFGAVLVLVIPTTTLMLRKYFFLVKNFEIQFRSKFKWNLIRKLISHGFLYGLALFLISNQKQIPVLLMTGRVDASEIGIYGVGLTFAGLIYQIFNALSSVIFLKSAKSKDPKDASLKIQKLMRVMFFSLIILGTIIFNCVDFIIPLIYGAEFKDSVLITKIMLVGIIFYNIFLTLNMDMAGKGKPWLSIFTLIPISILNVILNFYFIGLYGNEGAAASTSLSMGLAAFIFIYFYSKELKMPVMDVIKPRKSDWDFVKKIVRK